MSRYKVVPFIGRSRGSLSASDVAQQLEIAINEQASAGWEFLQISDVNIEVQPGCLGGLLGAKVEYARFDQLIFCSGADPVSIRTATHADMSAGVTEVIGADKQGLPQPEPASAGPSPRTTEHYRPERFSGGKIRCWKCRAANDPRQIRCAECDSQLYEPE